MSEDVKQDPVKVDDVKETTNQPAEVVKSVSESVPYSRFAEVIADKKKMEEKLMKFEDDQQKKRKKELEKQGEYKALLSEQESELSEAKAKAQQWEVYQTKKRDDLMKSHNLSERQINIANKLDLSELESYVDDLKENSTQSVYTDKSLPTQGRTKMTGNPFKNMTRDDRRKNWSEIVASYND
tara:strand:+ start:873 stop:1421 length:549 start_codon:yes stop_codon:yes gene_type:complete